MTVRKFGTNRAREGVGDVGPRWGAYESGWVQGRRIEGWVAGWVAGWVELGFFFISFFYEIL